MSHKAGFINIVGRANAGKSTLMNRLVGERLSIITAKAQTTRHRILGIVNTEDTQMIFSDTPGILDPKYGLQVSMMHFVKQAFSDADILVLLVDASDKQLELYGFDQIIQKTETPVLVVLNKIDLIDQEDLTRQSELLNALFAKGSVFPISALHNFGVEDLLSTIREMLPESPPYYEKDALTDKPVRFFVSEIIRERILENYQKEIPYSVQVEIESFVEEPTITRISAVIYVARKSQKGILIGHKGEKLKKVGTESRKLIESFIDQKVFLEMHVKVDEDWRNNERRLKAFGYKQ